MLQTAPPPCDSMSRTICCVRKNWARILTRYNRSNCSRVTSRNGRFKVIPELFTRQSTPPEEFDGPPSQFGHHVEVVEVRLDHSRPAPNERISSAADSAPDPLWA